MENTPIKTLEFMFQETEIHFLLQSGGSVMVNATEMARIFKKEVNEFLRLESTKKLIVALEKSSIRPYRTGESPVRSDNFDHLNGKVKHKSFDMVPLVIIRKGGEDGGLTWIHRYLAIEFATWLDIDFKIWTLRIIDNLLSSYTNARRELALRKKNVNDNIQKIIEESDNQEVHKLAQLLKEKDQIKGEEFNINKNFKKNLFS